MMGRNEENGSTTRACMRQFVSYCPPTMYNCYPGVFFESTAVVKELSFPRWYGRLVSRRYGAYMQAKVFRSRRYYGRLVERCSLPSSES